EELDLAMLPSALPNRDDGSLEDVRRRLLSVQHRDVGTAALSGFISQIGIPQFVVNLYREAVRAKVAIADVLTREPLPAGFIVPPALWGTGRITTAASVDVQ